MTREQRTRIGEAWIALAQMYGREVSRTTLSFMLDAIDDLEYDKVLNALKAWARSSKLNRHPLPSEVRDVVEARPEAKDVGRELALRIREAVTKFGWPNGSEARAFIGEHGWRVVEGMGGWLHICENLGVNIQESTFLAQCRDALESRHRLGGNTVFTDTMVIGQGEASKLIGALNKSLNNKLPTKE